MKFADGEFERFIDLAGIYHDEYNISRSYFYDSKLNEWWHLEDEMTLRKVTPPLRWFHKPETALTEKGYEKFMKLWKEFDNF